MTGYCILYSWQVAAGRVLNIIACYSICTIAFKRLFIAYYSISTVL